VTATDANDPTNTETAQFTLNVAQQGLAVTPAGGFSIPPATIGSNYQEEPDGRSVTFTVSGGSGTEYKLRNSDYFAELTQN